MMGHVIGAWGYAVAFPDVPFGRKTDQAACGPCMLTNLTRITLSLWSRCSPCVVFTKNRRRMRNLQNHGTCFVGGGKPVDFGCLSYLHSDYTNCLGWTSQVCWDVTANLHDENLLAHTPPPLRFPFAATFVAAIAFTETGVSISSHRVSAAHVPSCKSTGKLSCRRIVSNKYK